MHQVADLVFDAFFLVLVSAAVVTAWSWPFATGLFPLAIGIPVLIISLSQTAKDIIATKRGRNLRNRSIFSSFYTFWSHFDLVIAVKHPIRFTVSFVVSKRNSVTIKTAFLANRSIDHSLKLLSYISIP